MRNEEIEHRTGGLMVSPRADAAALGDAPRRGMRLASRAAAGERRAAGSVRRPAVSDAAQVDRVTTPHPVPTPASRHAAGPDTRRARSADELGSAGSTGQHPRTPRAAASTPGEDTS
ncbi:MULTISPECIES: hypothetical protein [Actinoalloteichus]|uniref:hypothetical protein n=1 Tax=Actinoalloteichus TaxID=65496 RepID=UPI0012FCE34E|nr:MULTISPECIES: hypothetical protein [Actinoalloteichus]